MISVINSKTQSFHWFPNRCAALRIVRMIVNAEHVQDPDRIRLAVYRINGLNKHLAEKLSIPMRDIDRPYCSCMAIEMHYDEFMTQTTRLLVLLLERKPNPFTSTDDVDNDIFEVIKWMQALWASRNAVSSLASSWTLLSSGRTSSERQGVR